MFNILKKNKINSFSLTYQKDFIIPERFINNKFKVNCCNLRISTGNNKDLLFGKEKNYSENRTKNIIFDQINTKLQIRKNDGLFSEINVINKKIITKCK